MHLILLTFPLYDRLDLGGCIASPAGISSGRTSKALRYERWKARRQSIPNVSANLCGSGRALTTPHRSRDRLRSAPPDGHACEVHRRRVRRLSLRRA